MMVDGKLCVELQVAWLGMPDRLWGDMQVLNYGHSGEAFEYAAGIATLIAVDPGDPSGVVCVPYERRFPITLHTISPDDLAHGLLRTGGYDLVCETPLHGDQRVYDPWPWKVRGFVELLTHSRQQNSRVFVPAEVGWLKAGKNIAHVMTSLPHEQRHAKDALAYAAMAVMMSEPAYAWQAENLGVVTR